MRRAIRTTVFAAAFFGLAGLTACGGDGGTTGPDQGDATLSVELTDEPSASVNRAWVKVEQITLQGTEGGVQLLDQPTGLIELTQLANRTETLVEDDTVPEGTYEQLRFIIAAAALETEEDEVYSMNGAADSLGLTATGDLLCPSCGQTGIKVNLPDGGLQLQTEAKILVLDFDVSESFGQQAGRSGMWVMRPLITSSTVGASGTIVGTVEPDSGVTFPTCGGSSRSVEDFVPRALDPSTGDVVKTGDVGSDGGYQIQFLATGDYDMSFAERVVVSPDTLVFDAAASPSTATVQSGAETTVDYAISAVTCDTATSSS